MTVILSRLSRISVHALLVVIGGAVGACSPQPALVRAEPQALYFSRSAPEAKLRLVHHGEAPLPLSRIRLDTRDADWPAFTLTGTTFPRAIAANGAVELPIRVDIDHFATSKTAANFRDGSAGLLFVANGQQHRVPLYFQGSTEPTWRSHALWAVVLLGLAAMAWRVRHRVPWLLMVATGVTTAITPLALAWCQGPATQILGRADLLQCADGRGGSPLRLFPGETMGAVLSVWLLVALGASVTRHDFSRRLRLVIALAGTVLAARSLDPVALLRSQAEHAWGIWLWPAAAAAVGLAAIAEVSAQRTHPHHNHARLTALGLSSLLVTLFLGGPLLPMAPPPLPHAAELAIGLVTLAAKVGLVAALLLRIRLRPGLEHLVIPLSLAAWLVHGFAN